MSYCNRHSTNNCYLCALENHTNAVEDALDKQTLLLQQAIEDIKIGELDTLSEAINNLANTNSTSTAVKRTVIVCLTAAVVVYSVISFIGWVTT